MANQNIGHFHVKSQIYSSSLLKLAVLWEKKDWERLEKVFISLSPTFRPKNKTAMQLRRLPCWFPSKSEIMLTISKVSVEAKSRALSDILIYR